MDIQKHPKNVKGLAEEIKKACDMYWGREITELQLKEVLLHYATKENRKLFMGNDYNPTIKQRIGKRRIELVNNMLEYHQMKL